MAVTEQPKKRILLVGNSELVIFKFRRELIERLVSEGYEVFTSFPQTVFGNGIDAAAELGCTYINTPLEGHGKNPLTDLKLYRHYRRMISEIKPDAVLTYTIKPNVFATRAASKCKVPAIVNITGLGVAVENPGLLRTLTLTLYRSAIRRADCVFFQNDRNEKFFTEHHIVPKKRVLLPGSGVNLERFALMDYPEGGETRFLFVGRMMQDKGIDELYEASRRIKSEHPEVKVEVVGPCEAEYRERFDEIMKSGIFEYTDWTDDVRTFFGRSGCVVQPSHHEGMSNTLLESASCGRPVIASNIPGCREICDDGKTGFLFEAGSSDDLYRAMKRFLELSGEEKIQMGLLGREKMAREFNREYVVDKYMEEIRTALEAKA